MEWRRLHGRRARGHRVVRRLQRAQREARARRAGAPRRARLLRVAPAHDAPRARARGPVR